MSDPTLKRSSVTINYAASDGYRSAVNYSTRGRMGASPPHWKRWAGAPDRPDAITLDDIDAAIGDAMADGSRHSLIDAGGLYLIVNSANRWLYLGRSVALWRRAGMHLSRLRGGRHENRGMQAAANASGVGIFRFVALTFATPAWSALAEMNALQAIRGAHNCYNIHGYDYAGRVGRDYWCEKKVEETC